MTEPIKYRTGGNVPCERCRAIMPGGTWSLTDGRRLWCTRECWDADHPHPSGRCRDCGSDLDARGACEACAMDDFQLRPPAAPRKVYGRFENRPAKAVKSLFPGSDSCLPGQLDLYS